MQTKQDNNIYFAVHKRGNNLRFVKTTEELIPRLFDVLIDEGFTIEKREGKAFDDNISNGIALEAVTEAQMRNTISSILKI